MSPSPVVTEVSQGPVVSFGVSGAHGVLGGDQGFCGASMSEVPVVSMVSRACGD